MWFIASVAWADRLTVMGTYLSPKDIIAEEFNNTDLCLGTAARIVTCTPGESGDHATLVVSVVSLFLLFPLCNLRTDLCQDTCRFFLVQTHSGDTSGVFASLESPFCKKPMKPRNHVTTSLKKPSLLLFGESLL